MSFSNLDFKYIISTETEDISLTNLPGINAQLKKLRQESIISEYVDTGKIAFDNSFSIKIDYLKYTRGSKFVSIEASMILKEKVTNKQI